MPPNTSILECGADPPGPSLASTLLERARRNGNGPRQDSRVTIGPCRPLEEAGTSPKDEDLSVLPTPTPKGPPKSVSPMQGIQTAHPSGLSRRQRLRLASSGWRVSEQGDGVVPLDIRPCERRKREALMSKNANSSVGAPDGSSPKEIRLPVVAAEGAVPKASTTATSSRRICRLRPSSEAHLI